MQSAAESLAADLEDLAVRTWARVRWGPTWGLTLREDGITDENLFRLRLSHPHLNVRKFPSKDEAANGADWEWWLGSDATGWVGLRIQAKKMLHMRYDELRHRAASQNRIQCRVLVEETHADARGRALFPLYCFYNGWDESVGWPDKVSWTVGCRRPANCEVVPDVRIFGCGLARASEVLEVLEREVDPLHARHTLPLQTPWSWLLSGGPRRRLSTSSAESILENLVVALNLTDNDRQRERYAELPGYAEAIREGWPSDELELDLQVPTTYVMTTDLASSPGA